MHIIKKRLQYRYFPVNIAIFPEHFFKMCYLYFINAPFINVLSFIYENVILLFTNILFKMLDINPLYCKKNHVWKYNLISFFWNFIIDFFFISEVLYERNCSTKVAAQPFKAGALQYFTGVCKKYVLQTFLKFTKKRLYWKPVSIKMRYHSQQFLKKETQAQLFFFMNFAKSFQNSSGWLLLSGHISQSLSITDTSVFILIQNISFSLNNQQRSF